MNKKQNKSEIQDTQSVFRQVCFWMFFGVLMICLTSKANGENDTRYKKITHDMGEISIHGISSLRDQLIFSTNRGVFQLDQNTHQLTYSSQDQNREIHYSRKLTEKKVIASDDRSIYLYSSANLSIIRHLEMPSKNEFINKIDCISQEVCYALTTRSLYRLTITPDNNISLDCITLIFLGIDFLVRGSDIRIMTPSILYSVVSDGTLAVLNPSPKLCSHELYKSFIKNSDFVLTSENLYRVTPSEIQKIRLPDPFRFQKSVIQDDSLFLTGYTESNPKRATIFLLDVTNGEFVKKKDLAVPVNSLFFCKNGENLRLIYFKDNVIFQSTNLTASHHQQIAFSPVELISNQYYLSRPYALGKHSLLKIGDHIVTIARKIGSLNNYLVFISAETREITSDHKIGSCFKVFADNKHPSLFLDCGDRLKRFQVVGRSIQLIATITKPEYEAINLFHFRDTHYISIRKHGLYAIRGNHLESVIPDLKDSSIVNIQQQESRIHFISINRDKVRNLYGFDLKKRQLIQVPAESFDRKCEMLIDFTVTENRIPHYLCRTGLSTIFGLPEYLIVNREKHEKNVFTLPKICQDSRSSYYNYGLSRILKWRRGRDYFYRSCAGLVLINYERLRSSILLGEIFDTYDSQISNGIFYKNQLFFTSGRDVLVYRAERDIVVHIAKNSQGLQESTDSYKPIDTLMNMDNSLKHKNISLGVIDTSIPEQLKNEIRNKHFIPANITRENRTVFFKEKRGSILNYHGANILLTARSVLPKSIDVYYISATRLSGNGNARFVNDEDIANAVYFLVKQNVAVINMSFGSNLYSNYFRKIVNIARSKNITLTSSAGNGNMNLDYAAHYPSNFVNVVAVGATDSMGNHVLNYGKTVSAYEQGYRMPFVYFDRNGKRQVIHIYGSSASSVLFASGLIKNHPLNLK